ncbi:ABC transporter permease [Williamwhitmania taraxaci]|uniref:ABC-type transport system involved in multi-copper enzyme maturation, permease component n=1 Tax=Williamwhitmania taraxaci TaxID=1640674 RepID=A0A1G6H4D4_9BACT|nr:ABC transporter permease [Williamwhitmania taraxaci]SDB89207.1 ABC-type transport system involved in multi-copper enzyme maturation, permease component [Williamwhitmania taraxaci]
MLSFNHINTIAHFEAKTLFRSWFFRIFGILMLLFLLVFDIEQISDNEGQLYLAVPSAIPYVNLLFLNLVQSIIAVFLASDFLKRDKKLDTTEVIYTRSMSNGDYILGKLLGVLTVFFTFNFLILALSLTINIISSSHQVCLESYLYYFLLISVPTLLFIIGLSFVLMNLIRNQAITFAVLLGYIFLTLFYLQQQYFYLFDYMAYNIPMVYSDLIGFSDIGKLLVHRLMYASLGLSFISFTVYRLGRLPNKPFSRVYPLMVALIFLIGSVVLGYFHIADARYGEELRKEMVGLNNQYSSLPQLSITDQHITLNHKGTEIWVHVAITVKNNESQPSSQVLVRLNPGLTVSKVESGTQTLDFKRERHLLFINMPKPLAIGDSAIVRIEYAGSIDQEACYIDIDEELRAKKKSVDILSIGEVYACIRSNYLFLTPEANWYPMANVGYNQKNTGWILPYFSRYTLTVNTFDGAAIIVSGMSRRGEVNPATFYSGNPLTGLSLVIGQYEKHSYKKQLPELGVWIKPGHDFYKNIFVESKDTAESIIYKTFQDFAIRNGGDYPFSGLYLVEVPIQVYSYPRYWLNHSEMVQPGMVFVPEKGGSSRTFRFKSNMQNRNKWGNEKDQDSLSLQIDEIKSLLDLFVKNMSRNRIRWENGQRIEDEVNNPYFIFDQFYGFNHPVVSEQYPIFTPLLGSYLSRRGQIENEGAFTYGFSEYEKAALLLREKSMSEIISNPAYNKLADNVMDMKGDALFSLLEQRVGRQTLDDIIALIRKDHSFRPIDYVDFKKVILERTGENIDNLIAGWLMSKELPGYRIGQVEALKVKEGQRQRYLTRLSIGNESKIDGIVKIAVRETGSDESSGNDGPSFKTYVVGAKRLKTMALFSDNVVAKICLS